jgi:hypothetical protein
VPGRGCDLVCLACPAHADQTQRVNCVVMSAIGRKRPLISLSSW